MIIFTEFHKDRRKIVDFSPIVKFWARELFSCTLYLEFRNITPGLSAVCPVNLHAYFMLRAVLPDLFLKVLYSDDSNAMTVTTLMTLMILTALMPMTL